MPSLMLRRLLGYHPASTPERLASTGLYVILKETVQPSVLATTVIAYCYAMVASFLGHKYVMFRAKGDTVCQSVRYVIVYLAGLALACFIMESCTTKYHFHYLVGILAVDVALPVLSLIFMFVFAFTDRAVAKLAAEADRPPVTAEQ